MKCYFTAIFIFQVSLTTIKVSWKRPEHDGGSKITSYIVQVSPTLLEEWVTKVQVRESTFQCTIAELVENSRYDVRVIAVNALGDGEPSRPLIGVKTFDDSGKSLVLKKNSLFLLIFYFIF